MGERRTSRLLPLYWQNDWVSAMRGQTRWPSADLTSVAVAARPYSSASGDCTAPRLDGVLILLLIHSGRLLDAYFSRAFYKQILGRKVDLRDLESVDPEYHKSLVWMLDNDITNVIDLDFSLEVDEFGDKKVIDLKPGGATIPVTEENKDEYVRLVVQYRLDSAIKDQIGAFLEGFYE